MRRSAATVGFALCVLWALYSLIAAAAANIAPSLTRNQPTALLSGCGEHAPTACGALPVGQLRLECLFRRTLAHIKLAPAKQLRSAAQQFLMCAVLTHASSTAEPRAAAVAATWGAQCDELLMLSSSRTAPQEMQLPARTHPAQWPALRALRAPSCHAAWCGRPHSCRAACHVALCSCGPDLKERIPAARAKR